VRERPQLLHLSALPNSLGCAVNMSNCVWNAIS